MLHFTDLVGVHFCFTRLKRGARFALFRTLLTHNFYARLTMLKPFSNFGLVCWVQSRNKRSVLSEYPGTKEFALFRTLLTQYSHKNLCTWGSLSDRIVSEPLFRKPLW